MQGIEPWDRTGLGTVLTYQTSTPNAVGQAWPPGLGHGLDLFGLRLRYVFTLPFWSTARLVEKSMLFTYKASLLRDTFNAVISWINNFTSPSLIRPKFGQSPIKGRKQETHAKVRTTPEWETPKHTQLRYIFCPGYLVRNRMN